MKQLKELIDRIISQAIPDKEKKLAEFDIFGYWKTNIAEDYNDSVSLVSIEKNSLLVETNHPVWIQRIREDKRSILKRIHAKFPAFTNINTIHCRLGKGK